LFPSGVGDGAFFLEKLLLQQLFCFLRVIADFLTVVLERNQEQQLGVRLSGWWMEAGIFILEVIEGSPAALCGKFEPYDRIVTINGQDVQSYRLEQASQLIQVSQMLNSLNQEVADEMKKTLSKLLLLTIFESSKTEKKHVKY
jgi:PDZ domain